ncbi:hypothetical protein [Antribacter gilvus]|uniref:hypothetical protein n=1 Tax=Antribacter gilvus TaxID=2304675 RepID=UPI000F781AC5|nr:hypothetical protein [Antribacter gilvus]
MTALADTTTPQAVPSGVSSGLSDRGPQPWFACPHGIRRLLLDVYRVGWRTQPDVPALLAYCEEKYELLARRYGQTAGDAAVAAFEVLRLPSTLDADDPWAVVTRAVQRTMQAADRADRLLCSVDRARRATDLDHHVERFSDLAEDMAVPVAVERAAGLAHAASEGTEPVPGAASARDSLTSRDVRLGMITARALLSMASWHPDDARVVVEYVCHGLSEHGNPVSALDALRRDITPLHLLDISHRAWTDLCRALLGEPGRPGLLERAVLGARPVLLLADARLMAALGRTAPAQGVRHA